MEVHLVDLVVAGLHGDGLGEILPAKLSSASRSCARARLAMCLTPRIDRRAISPPSSDARLPIFLARSRALEIVRDPQHPTRRAIDSHRLAAGDGFDGAFLDVRCRASIAASAATERRALDVAESAPRSPRRSAAPQAAHLGDHARELLQVVVEGFCCVLGEDH
jgi:hypothetical protein